MKNKNILIIGGNRFVGSLVTQKLNNHHKITVLNRTGTSPVECTIIKQDRNELNLDAYNDFDIIIDMCLYNLEQTKNIVEVLKKQDNLQQYIFVSSIASKLDFFGEYGVQKKECEDYIKSTDLPWVILNPTYILGENDPTNRFRDFIYQVIHKNNIKGEELITFVDAQDVCNIICKLIEKETNKMEFELACNEPTTITDLYNRLEKIFTTSKTPTNPTIIDPHYPYINKQCMASNFKIKNHLNYTFNSFDKTLVRLCAITIIKERLWSL